MCTLGSSILAASSFSVNAEENEQGLTVELSTQTSSYESELYSESNEYDTSKEARKEAVESYNEEHPGNPVINTDTVIDKAPKLLRAIIGADNRVKANTTLSPFKQIGYMEMGFVDKGKMVWYMGTGTLVSGDTVLTAGHNLYDTKLKKWASAVIFQPGMNNFTAPKVIGSKKLYSMVGYTTQNDSNYDIGLVKLSVSAGNTGYLSYKVPAANATYDAMISGYPGEKQGSQYYHTGKAMVGTQKIVYPIDTTAGQSGAPILNGKTIIGVHTLGSGVNEGVRITPTFNTWITSIK
ncbi:trypsin-like serine peptidase [Listeria booriae]|uniref:trypsin-like serine peptidase n=1 Tax=Listeria booriae TaxID=1552123 RepID=UPI00162A70AF|nr:trypsin-like serine protease [Listeria booriae]MBC1513697.1 trypsin-like serine protease [Listeria booriae]MBC6152633.1 trypsin-like serine protease [Listeria booriae]MBC6306457.1 trypsin-like serine protease [Listeria booriae]